MSFGATATDVCRRAGRKALVWLRAVTGYRENDAELGRASNRYWNDLSQVGRAQDAHWRGHGPFAVDDVWLKMGRDHKDLLHRVLRSRGQDVQRVRRVVEWGCGGGMNAVQFARDTDVYCGIDLSAATLDECGRQMQREGPARFVPVLVNVNEPRAALQAIDGRYDLFICTYVIELLPTESHALELIVMAAEMLESGGYALIQIRCTLGGVADRSRGQHGSQRHLERVCVSSRLHGARVCGAGSGTARRRAGNQREELRLFRSEAPGARLSVVLGCTPPSHFPACTLRLRFHEREVLAPFRAFAFIAARSARWVRRLPKPLAEDRPSTEAPMTQNMTCTSARATLQARRHAIAAGHRAVQ